MQVDGLHDEALLQDISLRLRKGEILGIAGLAGAGKTELCKALFGASKSRVQRGELNGQPWRPRDPADSAGAAWRWSRRSDAKRAFSLKSRSR